MKGNGRKSGRKIRVREKRREGMEGKKKKRKKFEKERKGERGHGGGRGGIEGQYITNDRREQKECTKNENRMDERRKGLDAWKQREGRREIRMTEGTEGAKEIEKEQKEERGN